MPASKRRIPRQQRSTATVDAIFGAAVQILKREGQEAFNTNRIAAVAGVSIGTLYQYFADKDAILHGLAQRETARIRSAIKDQLALPWPASLRAIVHTVLYAFDGQQAVRVAIFNARRREGMHAAIPTLRAFTDEIGHHLPSRFKIPEEAAFIGSCFLKAERFRWTILSANSFASWRAILLHSRRVEQADQYNQCVEVGRSAPGTELAYGLARRGGPR